MPDAAPHTVSVIIPTLNEAGNLPHLLAVLRSQPLHLETIVVDGGSWDGTPDLAVGAGARVIRAPRGRGQQLRAGAAAASGDILLFLHADCRFPPSGLKRCVEALDADEAILGGNFRLLFDGDDRFSHWLDGFYAFIRRLGLYYGDSGIFVRRAVYQRLGGIRPIALMEDYDFVRRMEASGPTCCIEEPPMITSSRRFVGRHPVRIVWGWIKIHALFHLGVSPERLARLYDSERRGAAPDEPQTDHERTSASLRPQS